MIYTIYILPSAKKSLAKLSKEIRSRIYKKVNQLATNPHPAGSLKLEGHDGWRIRVGDYRIIYEIINKKLTIWVIDIDHRKDIYR